jgi:hypothetical protein
MAGFEAKFPSWQGWRVWQGVGLPPRGGGGGPPPAPQEGGPGPLAAALLRSALPRDRETKLLPDIYYEEE